MPIVGFHFKKINIEKKGLLDLKHKITNSLKVTKLEKEKTESEDKAILRFEFEFSVDFGKAGDLELAGTVHFGEEKKKVEAYLKDYEKTKTIPDALKTSIYNTILYRCNIKALSLSQELGLPPHISLPIIK